MSGETENNVSGWTVDTLNFNLQRQLDDMRLFLDERYATQTKALDAAFVAAEKAVSSALASAEKAVTKAETASEKRFEATNEFRAQLSDQASHFATRTEVSVKFTALTEKVEADTSRINQQLAEINKRLDRTQGSSAGKSAMYGWVIAAVGLIVSVVVAMNMLSAG
jgi:hypothetical protein